MLKIITLLCSFVNIFIIVKISFELVTLKKELSHLASIVEEIPKSFHYSNQNTDPLLTVVTENVQDNDKLVGVFCFIGIIVVFLMFNNFASLPPQVLTKVNSTVVQSVENIVSSSATQHDSNNLVEAITKQIHITHECLADDLLTVHTDIDTKLESILSDVLLSISDSDQKLDSLFSTSLRLANLLNSKQEQELTFFNDFVSKISYNNNKITEVLSFIKSDEFLTSLSQAVLKMLETPPGGSF